MKYLTLAIISCLAMTWCAIAENNAGPATTHRRGLISAADGKPITGAIVRTIDADSVPAEGQTFPAVIPGLDKMYVSSVTAMARPLQGVANESAK
jgi:hypothetical protein